MQSWYSRIGGNEVLMYCIVIQHSRRICVECSYTTGYEKWRIGVLYSYTTEVLVYYVVIQSMRGSRGGGSGGGGGAPPPEVR